tara:strand:+ start:63 stop:461 length:399 start_codon:yes stop_codon:yes gene_type:complete
MKKSYLLAIIIVIFIALVFGVNKSASHNLPAADNTDSAISSFVGCLEEKQAVFYGAFWCPHCEDQKDLLEIKDDSDIYVECSTPDGNSQTSECAEIGIKSYPTWVFEGSRFKSGTLSLSELAAETGCELTQE